MSEFKSNPNLINKELANRSHSGTSFTPERRAIQEINGFSDEVQEMYIQLKHHVTSEAQDDLLLEEINKFQIKYAMKYNDKLSAEGRCISTFITGASNFPVRKAQKAQNSLENKINNMYEFKNKVEASILRKLKKLSIEEKGGEIPVLEMKIKEYEERQIDMKMFNSIIRKKNLSESEKIELIKSKTNFKEEMIIWKLKLNSGYEGWELQNNNANIKRMKERLIQLQTKELIPTNNFKFENGKIIDNAEIDRVQIIYDEKPDQSIINKLKSEGWRWSPSNKAWQRKRTTNAMVSAKRIVNYDNAR